MKTSAGLIRLPTLLSQLKVLRRTHPPPRTVEFFRISPGTGRRGSSFVEKPQGSMIIGGVFHRVQNGLCAHSVVSANLQRCKLKASVMPSRGVSPLAMPLNSHGLPSIEMEPTLITAEVHGWFTLGSDLESLLKCECLRLLHVNVLNV